MRHASLLIIVVLFLFAGCKTSRKISATAAGEVNQATSEAQASVPDLSRQETFLIGYFSPSKLTEEPYSSFYFKEYDGYQFNTDAVNKLMDISKDSLVIKVVMGTWCPDSRKQVPRFMRITDTWQFPRNRMTFIGVDDNKISPVAEYMQMDIQRVPTFIFYKNNIEIGRIIENPVTSLEQDMVNILTGTKNN